MRRKLLCRWGENCPPHPTPLHPRARRAEHETHVGHLFELRHQCEKYVAQLHTRRRELGAEEREILRLASEVKAAEGKMQSSLGEMSTVGQVLLSRNDVAMCDLVGIAQHTATYSYILILHTTAYYYILILHATAY